MHMFDKTGHAAEALGAAQHEAHTGLNMRHTWEMHPVWTVAHMGQRPSSPSAPWAQRPLAREGAEGHTAVGRSAPRRERRRHLRRDTLA